MELLTIAISALLGYKLGRFRAYALQHQGEALVSEAMAKAFPPPAYHLLNNVTLPCGDGTTQIDHILVSRFGVFVVETKHYRGWILADAASPQWTQVFYRHRYRFQNPLYQNYKHLKTVQALLDFLEPDCVQPLVVFSGNAEFRSERPRGVFSIAGLTAHIRNQEVERLSENRLQLCVGRLECARLALTRETDVAHRTHLQRRFGDRQA